MNTLEVTWIADDEIEPPGPKMVVCVEPFLKWDSFIECTILDLDDYVINQAVKKSGVIGRVSTALCDPLIAALSYASGSRQDRNAIRAVLERAKGG